MDLDSALLAPGEELAAGSAAHAALGAQLAAFYGRVKEAFGSGEVARLFPPDSAIRPAINPRDAFPGSMCLGLTLSHGEEPTSLAFVARHVDDFLVSLKSDGVRYLLMRTVAGGLFLLSRGNQIFQLICDNQPQLESLLDGELVFHSRNGRPCFLLFDSLLFHGQDRFGREYAERLRDCQRFEAERRFEESFGREAPLRVFTKDFFRAKDARVLVEKLATHALLAGHIDGLILARQRFPYLPGRSPGNLKWKPEELNSIDFLLAENPRYAAQKPELFPRGFGVFELYIGRSDGLMLFDFAFLDAQELERLRARTSEESGSTPCIGEMRWDREYEDERMNAFLEAFWGFDSEMVQELLAKSVHSQALANEPRAIYTLFNSIDRRMRSNQRRARGNWRLLRLRLDKQMPNAISTAENVMVSLDEQFISSQDVLAALENGKTLKRT